MKQKSLRMTAALLLLFTLALLCGCAPEFVGEAKAKQAGLALLRQAFGVSAADAHVEYFERAGSSVIDNSEIPANDRAPDQIYLVTISDQTLGIDLYYAEVDAKTGVAYYATKSEWVLTPLTGDQSQQATQINRLPDDADADAVVLNDGSAHAAGEVMMRRFKKEVALISANGCCCRRDNLFSSRVGIGYFVTFADGALYRVGFSWPSMELNEVEALGNELEGERP